MPRHAVVTALLLAAVLMAASSRDASAFPGAPTEDCMKCHTLKVDEAARLIKADKYGATIKEVRMSPVKGLWEVEGAFKDKPFVTYVDFSRKYLVEAVFTRLDELPDPQAAAPKKLDTGKIPLEHAVVYGDPKAEKRVIVFDDPECPYCQKLHAEIKKIIAKRKDVAFHVKLYPLPTHKGAYGKSKAIVCAKGNSASARLLDDAFAGKKLPEADCETSEIDNNIKLAAELGIHGTPGIILPDGRLVPGFIEADKLLELIDNPPQ